MNRKARKITLFAGLGCVVGVLLLSLGLYTLQTNWFKNKVKEKIVAAVEEVSGGRVDIGSFDYDWRTITAGFNNFVVHGTESDSSQPLFRADRVTVGLKITSIWKRNIDIASVVVDRPQVHLLMQPDGTTNIPVPRSRRVNLTEGVQELMDLRVRHFEFRNGVFQADLERIPLDLSAEDTSLRLAYVSRGRRYDMKVSSRELHVNSGQLQPFSGSLEADGRLERDRFSIQNAVFRSHGSSLQTSGTLQHFVHPMLDLRLSADVDASDFAAVTKFEDIARGRLTLEGAGHYDENTPFAFRGKITGRNVEYRIKSFDFKKVNLEADVLAVPHDLELTRFVVGAIGGTLSGHIAFKQNRDLQLDGAVAGLSARAAATLLSRNDLQWSGVASGAVHLRAVLDTKWRDLTVKTDLTIAPRQDGVPVAGEVSATYRSDTRALEFGQSFLKVDNTRLSFSGNWGANLDVVLDSTDLSDLNPAFRLLNASRNLGPLPTLLQNGTAHFDGKIVGALENPQLVGNVALAKFSLQGETWDQLRTHVLASANKIEFSSLILDQAGMHATADGTATLQEWMLTNNSAFQLRTQFRGADIAKLASSFSGMKLPALRGTGSGILDLQGTVLRPRGTAQLNVANLDAYGERLNELQLRADLLGDTIQVRQGHLRAGPAALSFSGGYQHDTGSWRDGQLQLKIDSNGFPVGSLAPVHDYEPGLNAQFEIHGEGRARITADRIEPLSADGTAALRDITLNNVSYGSISFSAGTRAQNLTTSFSGDLRGSRITGTAQVRLASGNPATGQIHVERIPFSTFAALLHPQGPKLPFEGFLQGGLTFEGPLQQINNMHGTISIEKLQLTPNLAGASLPTDTTPDGLTLSNVSPVVLQYADGLAKVASFQMRGRGSDVTVSGSFPLAAQRPMQVQVNGDVDLGLFQLVDANVRASGTSLVAASIGGTLMNPNVNGTLELRDGKLSEVNLPNGLTAVNGRLKFDRDRATIEKLTAQTGGGELSMGGFMTFGNGGPLVYRLEANAENVRVRYGGGVSVTATSQLRLTGTSENSILSGTATMSRVIFNPNTDVGNLLAFAAAPAASPGNEKDFLTGLQFDIHVQSAPNLQVNTELSRDLEADVDLRLRGTPERPILLGSIAANSGDIRVFGTKYTLNRGEVNFVNAATIEPVLDLDLQTQARGITVDITVSGTPGKLNINYRSDPPLQPRDIIALLTVGRSPNITSNNPDVSAAANVNTPQLGADTVLGQALSPSSNRLSKLFGITNIKIDPLVQGITNTPQARLTLEQQISKQITVTYVTNLSQTSEQIFRLEWAFSAQYSIVALRDDNGEFGIDIQYRKRFK